LADLELTPAPPRPELVQRLRARLGDIDPRLRFVAENLLGADAPIDVVAVDESTGRVVLLLLGAAGEDLELVGRALAQRAWVEARLDDWLQLAPDLGIRPGSGARVVLVCPSFRAETVAAVRALGGDGLQLARYRCLRNGAELQLLLEPADDDAPTRSAPREAQVPEAPGPPPFRSGLSDAQLALTPEEKAEFEAG
jgi:hypothetical protein